MSTILLAVLFLTHAWISAYWLCQLVEVILACPFATASFRRGNVSGRVFLLLFGQLLWVLCVAIISSLLIVEISAWPILDQTWTPIWPIHSGGLGLAFMVLALSISPRFREEVSAAADRRVLASGCWRARTRRWVVD